MIANAIIDGVTALMPQIRPFVLACGGSVVVMELAPKSESRMNYEEAYQFLRMMSLS